MEMLGLEKTSATIQDAKIYKISDLWSRKPRGLQFNDTDAVVVTLKTQDERTMKETFYFCLKPDGTFNVNTVSKDGSHARRQRLARFLKHYKLTANVDEYNLKEEISKWKGIEVAVVKVGDSGFIYVP
jgi:hypothetical protein